MTNQEKIGQIQELILIILQPKGTNQTIQVVNNGPNAEAKFFNKVKEWYQSYNERLC